jgi:hypothetical protein
MVPGRTARHKTGVAEGTGSRGEGDNERACTNSTPSFSIS